MVNSQDATEVPLLRQLDNGNFVFGRLPYCGSILPEIETSTFFLDKFNLTEVGGRDCTEEKKYCESPGSESSEGFYFMCDSVKDPKRTKKGDIWVCPDMELLFQILRRTCELHPDKTAEGLIARRFLSGFRSNLHREFMEMVRPSVSKHNPVSRYGGWQCNHLTDNNSKFLSCKNNPITLL